MPGSLPEHNDCDVELLGLSWKDETGEVQYLADATILAAYGEASVGLYGAVAGLSGTTQLVVDLGVLASSVPFVAGDRIVLYGLQGPLGKIGCGCFHVHNPAGQLVELRALDGVTPVAGAGAWSGGGFWHKGLEGGTGIALAYVPGSDGDYRGLLPGTAGHRAGRPYKRITYPAAGSTYVDRFWWVSSWTGTRRGGG